jgi:hypothetical protein
MIIALAGRRIDETNTNTPRFPLQNVDLVKARLRELFREREVTGLVCSAACGADLIALEIASELELKIRIVLPFNVEKFLKTSVIDRPGEWESIFKKIYYQASQNENVVIHKLEDDKDAYLKTNKQILNEAIKLADQNKIGRNSDSLQKSNHQKLLVVIVWDGNYRGGDDVTVDFAIGGLEHGFDVTSIMTT